MISIITQLQVAISGLDIKQNFIYNFYDKPQWTQKGQKNISTSH